EGPRPGLPAPVGPIGPAPNTAPPQAPAGLPNQVLSQAGPIGPAEDRKIEQVGMSPAVALPPDGPEPPPIETPAPPPAPTAEPPTAEPLPPLPPAEAPGLPPLPPGTSELPSIDLPPLPPE